MKRFNSFIVLMLIAFSTSAQQAKAPYFNSNGNQTPEYSDVIKFYNSLSATNALVKIDVLPNSTDVNNAIRLVRITKGNAEGKINILINNGIHPGEPEGIDAAMILTSAIINVESGTPISTQKHFTQKYKEDKILAHLLDIANIYIIPVYNVDGSLRRNSTTRANQNGPEEYGFRGNGRNLDLNRDFIKMDSRNAFAFVKIFQEVKPHLFIDTHTSNGADYQHVVTYIATQKDKLQKSISEYQYNLFVPQLNASLKKYKFDPAPYVNAWSDVPDSGWAAFYESPRFATGYSTLFNAIGFTLETHMLKNYQQRVEGSYAFLLSCIDIAKRDAEKIKAVKIKADQEVLSQTTFPLNWKLDSSKVNTIEFKGFEAGHKTSEVSGLPRLYYDRNKPFTKTVKHYENYKSTTEVQKPMAYVIPYAWKEVITRLQLNNVKLTPVLKDTVLTLQVYFIDDYKTVSKPYEGHYLHSNVKLHAETQNIKISAGDFLVYTDQQNVRFAIETLEPQAIDSYFNWNFFDATLAQKEYFSDYVFEDTAAELLKKDPALKAKLYKKKLEDAAFAKSAEAQLDFVYRNSSYFENSYLRYPIYRLEK
ncbi:MAG: hypothetical protein K9I48_02725 [Sphingobacteriales bacterium]|nr:hypothetical protein [Sphingobacteriales bacterium]